MPRLRSVDQLAIDEQAIEDDTILTALESWVNARDEATATRAVAKREKEAALKLLDELHIDVGTAVRVGRFRISRVVVPAKDVEFHADEKEKLSIRLVLD